MLLRHSDVLLRLLKLRIVVNGRAIYECPERSPVIIPDTKPGDRFMVTNGFHHSRTLQVKKDSGTRFYEVGCFIDNVQLLTGIVLTLFLFVIYGLTGYRLFMIAANLPLLIMLFLIYVKRNDFIQVHRLKTPEKLR